MTPARNFKAEVLRLTLRRKTALLVTGSSMVVAAILSLAFVSQMRALATDELRARVRTVGTELSNNMAFAAFSGDTVGLKAAVEATLRDIPDAAYVVFRDSKGVVLAAGTQSELGAPDWATRGPPVFVSGQRTVDQDLEVNGRLLLGVAAPMFIAERSKGSADLIDPLMQEPEPEKPEAARRSEVGSIQVGLGRTSLEQRLRGVTTRSLILGVLVIIIGALVSVVLVRLLTQRLENLTAAARGIAERDLRQTVAVSGNDEIGELAASFSTMTVGLRDMLDGLRTAAAQVESEASRILSISSQQVGFARNLSSALGDTTQTANQIAGSSRDAQTFADSVITSARHSELVSSEGVSIVQQAVQHIERLGTEVGSISGAIGTLADKSQKTIEIIEAVKDVANRIHVLSLNASIEAAKAGAHGKGFAVVAGEMRRLAELAARAARQIKGTIEEVVDGTRRVASAAKSGSEQAAETVALARRAGESISNLADIIKGASRAAVQVAEGTRNQGHGVQQILESVSTLGTEMNTSLAGIKDVETIAGNLNDLSTKLATVVTQYRIS
jgi:methyl-accepting chemotaxis protein